MDIATLIVTALTAGATAAIQDVASGTIREAYAALKKLIVQKFSGSGDVESAIKMVEKKPASADMQDALANELKGTTAAADPEVLQLAQALATALQAHDAQTGTTYSAKLKGDGAIAQGTHAKAVGAGGVMIDGNNSGNINTGTQTNNYYYGDERDGDAAAKIKQDPIAQKLYEALNGYAFAMDDMEDMCFELGVDWEEIKGANKSGKARALVLYMQREDRLQELLDKARSKRPRYQW